MLRYAIYARKSSDDRKDNERSIGEQVAECRKVQGIHGLFVEREIEESRTAKIPDNRPLWSELMADVKAGRINAILCWHINRLVRNMKEGGELAQMLIDGVVKEIRTPHAVHRTGDNIIALVLEAANATQSSLDLQLIVERAAEAKFLAGGWNCRAPQGYFNARNPHNLRYGIIVRDEARFDLIRKAWELMLTGTCTVQAVLDTLNDAWGYRTRVTENEGGGPLSHTALFQLFKNPFYAGFVRRRGRLLQGTHEAMVSVEEFQRVQRLLERRSFQGKRKNLHPYTGLMRCAYCGQQITAERKRLRNGSLWDNYRCSDSYHRCTRRGISLTKVETRISEELSEIAIDPDLAEIGLEEIHSGFLGEERRVSQLLAQQEAARKAREQRLNNLAEMWLSGLITDRGRYLELEEKELDGVNDLTIGIEKVRGEIAHMRENARRASDYAKFSQNRFQLASEAQKRAISKALVTEILFYGHEKRIEIKVAPLLLELKRFCEAKNRPFEPHLSSYHKSKSAALGDALCSGWAAENLTESLSGSNDCPDAAELPPGLAEALRGPLFPDLELCGIEGAP